VQPDTPLLLGVSGGPDSLCLLDALHSLGSHLVVAHLDHQLRPESGDHARAVEGEAARRSLRLVLDAQDVGAFAGSRKLSLEDAARRLRYSFLFNTARAVGAQAVVVGHTADDQAETLLMHLVRGAGLAGLKGMQHRTILPEFDARIPLVRPLLDMSRSEIEAYCSDRHLQPSSDPSNASMEFFRNRVRHELLPFLEGYNPEIRRTLGRAAEALASDYRLLMELIEGAWGKYVLEETPTFVRLSDTLTQAASPDLQRQLLRMAIQSLAQDTELDHAASLRALATATGPFRKRLDLAGGLSIIREPGAITIARNLDGLPRNGWPQMPEGTDSLSLSIPGVVTLDGGWSIQAEKAESLESLEFNQGVYSALLDSSVIPSSLEVRVRRSGDRFWPLGLGGHSQKLSDFFVNSKLPARLRRRWPLVCSVEGIVWIPGFRPSESHRRTAQTRQMVGLKAIPPARSS
jgi:tRNA(Ile)-lysidine synthase